MEIVWLGHSCFRLRGRDVTVVNDPCQPSTGYRLGSLTADIVTVSHQHPGHNNLAAVNGSPRVFDGPGEYEIKGVLITGVVTYHDQHQGNNLGRNLAFVFTMDDLRIGHLGDLGHQPTADQLDAIGDVDILLIPVGGHTTLDGLLAARVVNALDPRLVIPMHYATPASLDQLDPVDRFCKELGLTPPDPVTKLTLRRNDLPSETQLVVLDYRQ